LDDHFPRFPVLPGVFMLEAMTQACAWLIRVTDDFSDSIVTLKEARNVKYGRFVRPGQTLTIQSAFKKRQSGQAQFDVQGFVGGELAVSGKLTLEHYNLAERRPTMAVTDEKLKKKFREELAMKWFAAPAASISD
jgi:3-hydroxyacyl-[acyl-carrier-protein] dehydratase